MSKTQGKEPKAWISAQISGSTYPGLVVTPLTVACPKSMFKGKQMGNLGTTGGLQKCPQNRTDLVPQELKAIGLLRNRLCLAVWGSFQRALGRFSSCAFISCSKAVGTPKWMPKRHFVCSFRYMHPQYMLDAAMYNQALEP